MNQLSQNLKFLSEDTSLFSMSKNAQPRHAYATKYASLKHIIVNAYRVYLEGLPAAVLVPFSQSVAKGLRLRESNGSSLSAELSLETEAVTRSPSKSAGFSLPRMHAGFGSGNNDGLEPFSSLDLADMLISESARLIFDGCRTGSGSG